MHYAQLAAGTALISGNKNVEMCQAYILLSLYPVPAKRWEDQRSWLYLGLAIRSGSSSYLTKFTTHYHVINRRIATDLNLHLPNTAKPLNENHAREMLNRTRVWLNCFNLDRSTGSQYGKAPTISNADYMANHSENWWKSSPYNMQSFDIQICAYNSELKVMAAFIGKIYSDPHHPTGLNRVSSPHLETLVVVGADTPIYRTLTLRKSRRRRTMSSSSLGTSGSPFLRKRI
jgi:hypothetical protein